MSYLTANGTPCSSGIIRIPRIGAWSADLVIEDTDPDPYSGRVKIGIHSNAIQMTGTAVRYNVQFGCVMARVVGGAGGLAQIIPPKAYQSTSLKVVLGDICSAVGESLSSVCDPPTMATGFPFWNRFSMTAGQAIQAALLDLGVAWRTMLDGSIYVGPETYPPTGLINAMILDQMPIDGAIEFYADTPSVLPGQSFQGRPVSRVEHYIEEAKLRSYLLFEVIDP